MAKHFKLSASEKRRLKNDLSNRHGRNCHYCGLPEDDFRKVWGGPFYGGFKRGRVLEIDRTVNSIGYEIDNCVLACAICNMSKSDKFSHDEFIKVGAVIREIWQSRK